MRTGVFIFTFRYTLLVGKPPFETQTLKDTYLKIKKNDYHIPGRIGPVARSLIQRLLQGDPTRRPTVDMIIADDFMTMGKMTVHLVFILATFMV